jgi:hypothetical protein
MEDPVVRDDRGIDLKKLSPGVQLTVETYNSTYQVVLVDNQGKITIQGGTKENGDTRYAYPVPATFIGSLIRPPFKAVKQAWIGFNMSMQIGVGRNGCIATSPVQNVVVEAEDGSWFYSLDWNN